MKKFYIALSIILVAISSLNSFNIFAYSNAVSNTVILSAEQNTGFGSTWYYYVIGALLVAIVVIVLLLIKTKAHVKQSNTDELTGFPTVSMFKQAVDEQLKGARAKEYELISLDIDIFKIINTHFSTEKGDQVIVAMAKAIQKGYDGKFALITRATGDRFFILRKAYESDPIDFIYRKDISPAISEVLGEKYHFTMSFGKILIKDISESSSSLISKAETAREKGKTSHETTFIEFDDNMNKSYQEKVNITFRMEQALKDKEFKIEYQPKVNFETMELAGAEALVRWYPKLGDPIYPESFIPIFEENGFISTLDLYVLEEACKFVKANKNKMKVPRIAVNLSAQTILTGNIAEKVHGIISKYFIERSSIELEVTESAVESDTDTFLKKIAQLKKLGCIISIDDFGAGVSSLNRLSSIEADILKLDKTFFDVKDKNNKNKIVVSDVIKMAKHLHMMVVAEGVETYAQAVFLKVSKCDFAQGYFFDKPMSEEDFIKLVQSEKTYAIKP